jgi:hypothetical protein
MLIIAAVVGMVTWGVMKDMIKFGLLASAILSSTVTPVFAQEASRMEPLLAESGKGVPQGTLCTADKRWCLFISDTGNVNVYDGQLPIRKVDGKRRPSDVITNPANTRMTGAEVEQVTLWPSLIRKPNFDKNGRVYGETIIYGVQSTSRAIYSGGAASATWLELSALMPYSDGRISGPSDFGFLVKMPLRANKSIRACFSEEDAKRRLGVCEDDYRFDATLTLGRPSKNKYAWPELLFQSTATAIPGISTLAKDNTKKQLKESDLIPRQDKKCSYARVYKYNGEEGIYTPSKAQPDCSDYTTP